MTSEREDACPAAPERDPAEAGPGGGLPPMTPETARRLAALLAPHLVAMRAVTTGTPYDGGGTGQGGDRGGPGTGPGRASPVSPATKIFIAGMLELIS